MSQARKNSFVEGIRTALANGNVIFGQDFGDITIDSMSSSAAAGAGRRRGLRQYAGLYVDVQSKIMIWDLSGGQLVRDTLNAAEADGSLLVALRAAGLGTGLVSVKVVSTEIPMPPEPPSPSASQAPALPPAPSLPPSPPPPVSPWIEVPLKDEEIDAGGLFDDTYTYYEEEEEEEEVVIIPSPPPPPPPPRLELPAASLLPAFANATAVPSCAPGYEPAGGGACQKADVCSGSPCFPGVLCVPLPPPEGGFRCGEDLNAPCPPGYQGDGIECADVDECAGNSTTCAAITTCQNIPGDYLCKCPAGSRGSGKGSNACILASTPCSAANGGCWKHPSLDFRSTCTSTGALSGCGPCPEGFDGDPEGECVEVDGCTAGEGGACGGGALCVDDPPPSTGYSCACPEGMEYDEGTTACVDIIDPCEPACFEDAALGVQVACVQLAPGMGAACGPCPASAGLAGDGTVCTHSSPCAANPCFVGGDGSAAACSDAAAPATGYICGPCPRGYEGDGEGTCRDIDECAAGGPGAAACGPRATCANLVGRFDCTPLPRDASVTSCAESNGGCDPLAACCEGTFDAAGACVPGAGGLPACGPCPPGYGGSGDGLCMDFDGCAANPCFADPLAPALAAGCEDTPAECFAGPSSTSTCPPAAAEFSCGPCPVGFRGDGESCDQCEVGLAIKTSTTDATGGVMSRSVELMIVGALSAFEEGCNTTGGVQFTWTIVSETDPLFKLPPGVKTRTKSLFVPGRSLPVGQYTATLRACMSGNGRVCSSAPPLAFEVAPTPLTGSIAGGGVSTGEANVVSLDSMYVIDPDDPDNLEGEWLHVWGCSTGEQGAAELTDPCETPGGLIVMAPPGAGGAARRSGGGGEVSDVAHVLTQLKGAPGGKPYLISLVAIKGSRQIELQTPVVVHPGKSPTIELVPLPKGGAANPGELVVVTARVLSNSTRLTTEWAAFLDGEETAIEGVTITETPIAGGGILTSFVAALPAPPPGMGTSAWSFIIVAGDADGTATGQVEATVYAPPSAAGAAWDVIVTPGPEIAAGDSSTLSMDPLEWATLRPPLTFLYTAHVVGGGGGASPLTGYSPDPDATVYLPSGLASHGNIVEVSGWARDAGGLRAQGPTRNVTVAFPSFDDTPGGAEAWAANALADAASLLASGGPEAALQLVSLANSAAAAGGGLNGTAPPPASEEAVAGALSVIMMAAALSPPTPESAVAISSTLSGAFASGPAAAASVGEAGAAVANMINNLPPGSLTPNVLGPVAGALGGMSTAAANLPPAAAPVPPPPPAATAEEYAALEAAVVAMNEAEAAKSSALSVCLSSAPLSDKIAVGQAESAAESAEQALLSAAAAVTTELPSEGEIVALQEAVDARDAAVAAEEAAVAAAVAAALVAGGGEPCEYLAGADGVISEAVAIVAAANATVVAAEGREPPPPTPDPTAVAQNAVHGALTSLSGSLISVAAGLPPGVGGVEIQEEGFALAVKSSAILPDGSSPLLGGPPLASGEIDVAVPQGALAGVDPALVGGGGGALVAELLVSDFNPHSGASAGSPSDVVSSVVSFSLYGAGGDALPISKLEKPIYFDIPLSGVEAGAGGAVASCVFYDEETKTYGTEGCIGMPNPVPQGLRLSWVEGFTVDWSGNETTAAKLGRGWDSTHPWLFRYCEETFEPLTGFRLYKNEGGTCEATDPLNYLGCYWDFETQSFAGPLCVVRPKQRCLCTHLTDFAVDYGPPKIRVASLSEMALSPADVLKIWKMALIVLALVTIGIVGVLYTSHRVRQLKRHDVEVAKSDPATSFREFDGAWTWPFYQVYKDGTRPGQVISVEGPGPTIAVKLGFKYNRIRQAVPFGLVRGVQIDMTTNLDEFTSECTGYDLMGIQVDGSDRVASSLDAALLKEQKAAYKAMKEAENRKAAAEERAEFSALTTKRQRKDLRAHSRVFPVRESPLSTPGPSVDFMAGRPGPSGGRPAGRLSAPFMAGRPGPSGGRPAGRLSVPSGRLSSGAASTRKLLAVRAHATRKSLGSGPVAESFGGLGGEPSEGDLPPRTPVFCSPPRSGSGGAGVPTTENNSESLDNEIVDSPSKQVNFRRLSSDISAQAQPRLSIDGVVKTKAAGQKMRRAASVKGGSAAPDASAGFSPDEWADRLVGTSLVLANMSVRKILPSSELSARVAAATRLFGGMTLSCECSLMFPDLLEIFRTQLSLNQTSARGWYKRAQIFQLLMLQDLDGSFDADDDLAAAVFARGRVVQDDRSTTNPKVFDVGEITSSAPPALVAAAEEGRLNGEDPMRVWASLLALAVLEREGYDWEVTGTFGEIERLGAKDSVVRRGQRYLRYTFYDVSREEEVGVLRAAAAKCAEKFETRQSVAIRSAVGPALRAQKHPTAQVPLHKRLAKLAKVFGKSALELHTVARCFTAPIYHPFQRRARVWVLVNYWMGALCVSVWLQAERTVQCCLQASYYMGCGWLPTEEYQCTGSGTIHGSCSALFSDPALTRNATAAAAAALRRGEEQFDGGYYHCGAFPDPSIIVHKVFMVLLMILVPVPVKVVLKYFFEQANAAFVSPHFKTRSAWESLNLLIDTSVLKQAPPWATGDFMHLSLHLDPGSDGIEAYIKQARNVMRHRKAARAKWDSDASSSNPKAGRSRRRLSTGPPVPGGPPTSSDTFVLYGGEGSVLVPRASEMGQESTPALIVSRPPSSQPTHFLEALGGGMKLMPSPAPASLIPRVLHTRGSSSTGMAMGSSAVRRSQTEPQARLKEMLQPPERARLAGGLEGGGGLRPLASNGSSIILTPIAPGRESNAVLVARSGADQSPEIALASSQAASNYLARTHSDAPQQMAGMYDAMLEAAGPSPGASPLAGGLAPLGEGMSPSQEATPPLEAAGPVGGAMPPREGGSPPPLPPLEAAFAAPPSGPTSVVEAAAPGAANVDEQNSGWGGGGERWLDPVGEICRRASVGGLEVVDTDGAGAPVEGEAAGPHHAAPPAQRFQWHIPMQLSRTWSGRSGQSELSEVALATAEDVDIDVEMRGSDVPPGVGGWWLEPGSSGGGEAGGVTLGRGPTTEARSSEAKKRQAERGAKSKSLGLGLAAKGARLQRHFSTAAMDGVKSMLRAAKDLQDMMGQQLPEMSDAREITQVLHLKQLSQALSREAIEEKKRKVWSRVGWIMSTLSIIIFIYMIYVYGVKMYTNVGKGAELDFLIEYLWFMFLDNMVYSWATVMYKVMGAMSIIYLMKEYMMHHGNPFYWFESYDDGVLNNSLGDDLQNLEEVDTLGLGD